MKAQTCDVRLQHSAFIASIHAAQQKHLPARMYIRNAGVDPAINLTVANGGNFSCPLPLWICHAFF